MNYEFILKASLCREPNCGTYTKDARLAEIENIQVAKEYAEPGYTDPEKAILFANWNYFPRGIDTMLENYGYAIEWSDEWATCGNCYRAVRMSADSWQWQPSFTLGDGEITCVDCLKSDPGDYLRSLEDDPNSALNVDIDPSEHSYVKIEGDFENGLHPGQNDNPRAIYRRLSEKYSRIIFKIDSSEPFTTTFSVWYYQDRETWYSSLHGFTFELALEDARSAAHPGQCDADVKALSKVPYIAAQLDALDPAKVRAELRETGAWDESELSDHAENLQRLLWIVANDITEENENTEDID
jgi:hypothetical protein